MFIVEWASLMSKCRTSSHEDREDLLKMGRWLKCS